MFGNYIRSHSHPPPPFIVRVRIQIPKIGQKGRDAKHSLNWGYVKKGERSQKVGGGKCLKCKSKKACKSFVKMLCRSKNKKKIH